jgi:hypothetical protein
MDFPRQMRNHNLSGILLLMWGLIGATHVGPAKARHQITPLNRWTPQGPPITCIASKRSTRVIRNKSLAIEFQIPAELRAVSSGQYITIYTQPAYEELQYIIRNRIATEPPRDEAFITIVSPLPLTRGSIKENIGASHDFYLREGFDFRAATVSGLKALIFTQRMFYGYNATRIAIINPSRDFMLIIGSGENIDTLKVIIDSLKFNR